MDDLVALFDADEENNLAAPDNGHEEGQSKKRGTEEVSRRALRPSHGSLNPKTSTAPIARPHHHHPDARRTATLSQTPAEASIDAKLGIRMTKRKVSSVDLMDMISIHPYHSPAAISAMSLSALNRLLLDPAAVISDATVTGKTSAVTVGIIFTNSGTRVSGNGRAFSILSIGNLSTGPALTVFLFGDAYSRHCTTCVPGTVIALTAPRLVPPKEGSQDRTISLSVNASQQLVPVATARDYGTCKGKARVKRADGQWSSNGVCRNFVDTSISPYCLTHRKQANTKNGKVGKKNTQTFVQRARTEAPSSAFGARRSITQGRSVSGSVKSNSILTIDTPQGSVVTHVPKRGSGPGPEANNTLSLGRSLLQAPTRLKREGTATPAIGARRPAVASLASFSSQPTASARNDLPRQRGARASATTNIAKTKHSGAVHDWLNEAAASSKSVSKENNHRAVNRDTGTFDGTVAIPRPNKRFRSTPAQPLARGPARSHQLEQTKKTSVLQAQKLLASRSKTPSSKEQHLGPGNSLAQRPKSSSPTQQSRSALKDTLYGNLSELDMDKIASAESRFAREANAEAYAKSRRTVAELEHQENRKTMADNRKKERAGGAGPVSIERMWTCKTCDRTSATKPNICIRRKHHVVLERSVKQATTVEEKRLQIGSKTAEEGGLVLGAGLEWDRRRMNSYR